MNILLADSDRDFLKAYQTLLTMGGHTVTSAFDGTQVVSLLGQAKYDFCILDETLPRIENDEIIQLLKSESIPVIVLTINGVTVKSLLKPALPSAYLSFPFLPSDLTRLIRAVREKKESKEILFLGGVEVDVPGFCFSGSGTPLTNGEIDLLSELKEPRKEAGKRTRVMIQALNEKMKQAGKQSRIVYEMEKGYRLVKNNG